MKSNRIFSTNGFSNQSSPKAKPTPEMISRQIESLRVILRRVKNYDSTALDSLINQKLQDQQ